MFEKTVKIYVKAEKQKNQENFGENWENLTNGKLWENFFVLVGLGKNRINTSFVAIVLICNPAQH